MLRFILTFAVLFAPRIFADNGYFNQFLYHAVNTEHDPDFPPKDIYYFATGDFPFDVPVAGGDLEPMLTLFLQSDGTFQILYSDGIRPTGDTTWPPRQCFLLNGTWSVPASSLILKDANEHIILQADPAVVNGDNAMTATFTSDFPVAELHGVQHAIVSTQSVQPQSAYVCGPFGALR